ncbi:uncharacterized protein LOC142574019 [Dermacentor variabilis]|uniref:uncharacterized protein LOC142574019 n=1 Tax=Dermacentor variabilis TaxID=34621 RepID=UPI003F5B9C2A
MARKPRRRHPRRYSIMRRTERVRVLAVPRYLQAALAFALFLNLLPTTGSTDAAAEAVSEVPQHGDANGTTAAAEAVSEVPQPRDANGTTAAAEAVSEVPQHRDANGTTAAAEAVSEVPQPRDANGTTAAAEAVSEVPQPRDANGTTAAAEAVSEVRQHLDANGTTAAPEAPQVSNAPCNISYIQVSENVSVASKCRCREGNASESEDDEDYDSYEDDSLYDIVRFSEPDEETTGPTETDTKVTTPDVTTSRGLDPETATPKSRTRKRSVMLEDGARCVAEINNREAAVITGVCSEGSCTKVDTISYKLPNARPTVVDPYDRLCKVNKTQMNKMLKVVLGCIASCHELKNNSWKETRLDDGRLCALPQQNGQSEYMKRTGVCRNGSCVTANLAPWTHPNGCKDESTRINGKVLAVRCTDLCKNNTEERLDDGTPCLLQYTRKIKVPTVSQTIVEGICKNGECIITPPTPTMMVVNVPEESCTHLLSSVSYTEKVESVCFKVCSSPERRVRNVEKGSYCALKTEGKWWPKVTEVGECIGSACMTKSPDKPPPHEELDVRSHSCRKWDYVTVIAAQLIVAESCQVECADGVFENRVDGVKCLLEYSLKKEGRSSQGWYKIGVCQRGFCVVGKHSQTIRTDD